MITFAEFKKADIRIGTILSAEKVPEADRLIKLMVNLGEESPRQILSGIAEHYPDPSVLVGKQVPVLANLPTRTIRGLESQGMVLYAVGEGFLTTVEPEREVPRGTPVQ
ncbi:MAG: methionine--tRNA ligase [Patescibacteria group bacterium]